MTRLQQATSSAGGLLAHSDLFKGLSSEHLERVASLLSERTVAPGEAIVREGDPSTELIVIIAGAVEITKRAANVDREQRIATLPAGATIGEMTLLDRAPRSATARAIEATRVAVLPMDSLEAASRAEPAIERALLRNLANELSRRLRFTNDTTVAALEQQLKLERARGMMGRFVVVLAFMMVTYTFTLYLAMTLLPPDLSASAITVPMIAAYAVALFWIMRRSGLPLATFGLSLDNWRPALREGLFLTVAMCAAATAVKAGLVWNSDDFAGQRIFNLMGILDPATSAADLRFTLVLALLYAAAAPFQEFIVRSGLQAPLERALVGRWIAARAIVISNAMFASAHLHLSLSFAIFAFVPGLLWGTLFARQRSLVGVGVSHVLSGWFAFLVLGFEPWY